MLVGKRDFIDLYNFEWQSQNEIGNVGNFYCRKIVKTCSGFSQMHKLAILPTLFSHIFVVSFLICIM